MTTLVIKMGVLDLNSSVEVGNQNEGKQQPRHAVALQDMAGPVRGRHARTNLGGECRAERTLLESCGLLQ